MICLSFSFLIKIIKMCTCIKVCVLNKVEVYYHNILWKRANNTKLNVVYSTFLQKRLPHARLTLVTLPKF